MTARPRYRGCLLGLAAGDALGTTLEFSPARVVRAAHRHGRRRPVRPEPRRVDRRHLDGPVPGREPPRAAAASTPSTSSKRYCRWWKEGHLSATGRCFDIGTTRAEPGGVPEGQESLPRLDGGDGGGQRLADAAGPGRAGVRRATRRTPSPRPATAPAPRTARPSAWTPAATSPASSSPPFTGERRSRSWPTTSSRPRRVGTSSHSPRRWRRSPAGSFAPKSRRPIRGTGYVIDTLEAALWAFHGTETFRAGALRVVNLGEDADTTGAVYGQIAGRVLRGGWHTGGVAGQAGDAGGDRGAGGRAVRDGDVGVRAV